eukprot:3551521-Amphidinium_carterae.1
MPEHSLDSNKPFTTAENYMKRYWTSMRELETSSLQVSFDGMKLKNGVEMLSFACSSCLESGRLMCLPVALSK